MVGTPVRSVVAYDGEEKIERLRYTKVVVRSVDPNNRRVDQSGSRSYGNVVEHPNESDNQVPSVYEP